MDDLRGLTPAQVHGSWRARHRVNNIERMAKAIAVADWAMVGPQHTALLWEALPERDQRRYLDLAEAAYDAL
jgi:hypothetical protein